MELEHFITGEPEKGTILFVHGVGGNASQFKSQHDRFSDHYRVVSISLRGHGGSPRPSPNTTEQYALEVLAEDILALVKKLELNNIHYVGNSLGGVLGYLVITKSPAVFQSLTTFGTTGQMRLPGFIGPVVRGVDAFMLRFFEHKYLNFIAGQTGVSPASRKAIYQLFLTAVQAIPHIRYHLASYNFLDVIAKLPVPYTLIQCEHDKDIDRALQTTLEAMAKNSKAKVVPLKGVGHIANLDDPDGFNELLARIIAQRIEG